MKSYDLNVFFPTAAEISDVDTSRICTIYNFCLRNKRLCVHKKGSRYHLMCWNFQPSWFKGFAPYNQWFSVGNWSSDCLSFAVSMFISAVIELLKDLREFRTNFGTKVTLDSIIQQLLLVKELGTNELQ